MKAKVLCSSKYFTESVPIILSLERFELPLFLEEATLILSFLNFPNLV